MENKREVAKKIAQNLNWADIVGNIENLKVEMLWRLYASHIFDGMQVGATQYQETKQAYFVGFSEAFKVLSDVADRYDENEANDILTRLSRESNAYIDSLLDRTLKPNAPSGGK